MTPSPDSELNKKKVQASRFCWECVHFGEVKKTKVLDQDQRHGDLQILSVLAALEDRQDNRDSDICGIKNPNFKQDQ